MSNFDLNKELLFSHKPPAGPFVMVNLFSMKEDIQFRDYVKEITSAAQRLVSKAQGEILYSGEVEGEFTNGEIEWDGMILVRFPDWETLLRTLGDKIDEANTTRRKYLRNYKWVLTTSPG